MPCLDPISGERACDWDRGHVGIGGTGERWDLRWDGGEFQILGLVAMQWYVGHG